MEAIEIPGLQTGPPTGLSVLIVEDQEDAATSLAVVVSVEGHAVRIARDGPAGVRAVREWQPDVVLLDIGLPGLDGYQVAREIHAMNLSPRPLLIAMTGYGTADDQRKSREAGIDVHLVKPVPPELLLQLLRRFQRTTRGKAIAG